MPISFVLQNEGSKEYQFSSLKEFNTWKEKEEQLTNTYFIQPRAGMNDKKGGKEEFFWPF